MTVLLLAIIAVLLGIIAAQYLAARDRSRGLEYLSCRLADIAGTDSMEKLKLVTGDKALIDLVVSINRLLEFNDANQRNFTWTKLSMKKMLSNISHDLKTPLTVVLGYIETLRRYGPTLSEAERESLLLKMEEKAQDVQKLINCFFDLAKLESGDRQLPLSRVNMNEVCRRNMLAFYDILTAQGLVVDIAIPETPLDVTGNEEALDRILNNLLSNAVKYGGESGIVGLLLREEEGFVYTEVWDRGRGIDEWETDWIFERMYTLDDARNASNQGSGLGLTITKRLVELQGGGISVKSKPYAETRFAFKLRKVL